MFIIYLHTKCRIPGYNGTFIISVRLRTKWKFSHDRHVFTLQSTK